MIYELILAVTLQTAACGNPQPSITSNTVNFTQPTRVCETVIGRPGQSWCRPVVYGCAPYMHTTFYRVAEFADYMSCMERVATIGEDSHVRGICHPLHSATVVQEK